MLMGCTYPFTAGGRPSAPIRPRALLAAAMALCAAAFFAPSAAGAAPLDPAAVLADSNSAIGREVADRMFVDSEGRPLRLSSLRGQPVVLSLIYTTCGDICPVTTQALARAVEQARAVLGPKRFAVLTVGFDSRHDTPAGMREFAQRNGLEGAPDWHFVSGELPDILGLAQDLGFSFWESRAGLEHIAQTSILASDGRVAAQVYGADFATPMLVEPLKSLVAGELSVAATQVIGSLVERVRLFCTVYDPAAGHYKSDYSILIESVVGFVSIVGTAVFAYRNRRRPSHKGSGPC